MIYTIALRIDVDVSGKRVPRSDMREAITEAISDCLATGFDDSLLDALAGMGIDVEGVSHGLEDVETT